MTISACVRHAALDVALLFFLGSIAGAASAETETAYLTSLEYATESDAYDNGVLAAYVGEMLYPRVAIDWSPSSPRRGTTYLLGLESTQCGRPVVVRSFDSGETWEQPPAGDLCLPGLNLDVVVDAHGTLIAASWGPKVVRSVDGGLTWDLAADLGSASAPTSLAYDPFTQVLYLAWAPLDRADEITSSTPEGPILLTSSRDSGLTWSEPISVLGAATRGSYPKVVAFRDSVLMALIASTNLADPFIASVASQDGGLHWSAAIPLSRPSPCARWSAPAAAVSPSGVFAITWYESGGTGTGPLSCWEDGGALTETLVSISRDNGRTFAGPYAAGRPPGWSTVQYMDGTAIFDEQSRLYVTWHSVSADGAAVYVSHSSTLEGGYEQASFTTHFQLTAGNATGQQNMAVGPDGTVYLVWRAEAYPFEPPSSGIFFRGVSGLISGDVLPSEQIGPRVPIEVELYDALTERLRARVPWSGSAISLGALPVTSYELWLRLGEASVRVGEVPVLAWGRTTFTITVEASTAGSPGPPTPWLASGLAAAILFTSAVFAAFQYSRVVREDVLQRNIRLLMFGYVRDHPGSSFSVVRDAMGLKNGVAAYHLGVLEKQGLLHSESRRRHRWFFPNGDVSLWKDLPLSHLQRALIREVQQSPGIAVRELSRAVDRRPSSVSDNVRSLVREGILRTERLGRKVRCFPSDEGQTRSILNQSQTQ